MPGNPKPRKNKPTPRRTIPKLPDLLRQTHVLCSVIERHRDNLVGFCSCGEFFDVGGSPAGITLAFRAHRDDA